MAQSAMQGEPGRLHRLEHLAPGTRVRLASGRVGTLLEVNFTRAIVELERGEDRRREIAPGSEVKVLNGEARATGPETGPQAAEMRNTDRGQPGSPTQPCYASGRPPL